jgi:hypothetical protein
MQIEFNDAHVLLAIAYVRSLADAQAEAGKMMKLNPAMTLNLWRQGYSFQDSAILDGYSPDLLKAGLPEK